VKTLAFELEQAWIRENKLLTEHSPVLPPTDDYQHMHTKVPGSTFSMSLCDPSSLSTELATIFFLFRKVPKSRLHAV